MRLDNRFKVIPFCCFGAENCTNYLGQKGYFANDIEDFHCIDLCSHGTLNKIHCDQAESFRMKEYKKDYKFFIPEYFVIQKEKQYRPFKDTREFFIKTNFEAGDVIHVNSKTHNTEIHLMITGWTDNELLLGNLRALSFNELFELLELWDCEYNKFIPFGVEE